jgi:hypothetical protein
MNTTPVEKHIPKHPYWLKVANWSFSNPTKWFQLYIYACYKIAKLHLISYFMFTTCKSLQGQLMERMWSQCLMEEQKQNPCKKWPIPIQEPKGLVRCEWFPRRNFPYKCALCTNLKTFKYHIYLLLGHSLEFFFQHKLETYNYLGKAWEFDPKCMNVHMQILEDPYAEIKRFVTVH